MSLSIINAIEAPYITRNQRVCRHVLNLSR